MQTAICSFSFHRLLAAGKQDVFQYIRDCKDLGCAQLDPWNAHLAALKSGDEVLHAGHNPGEAQHLSAADEDYIERVRAAADKAGLPFGCIAVDGAHIYDPDPNARAANRARAYRWLDVAHKLGAAQVRIDAGGPQDMPADVFAVIKEGYDDVIARARPLGVEVLVENHWGPTVLPENIIKLVEGIDGLGLLFDTHNWRPDKKAEARERCAKYARATHVKTLAWDDAGNEIGEDVATAISLLRDAGYRGVWGIESVPPDGDEYGAARKTIALLERLLP